MIKMDINQTDVTIFVSMSLGIVLMSLVFPSLGLAGDEAQRSEIPEFDVRGDRFDFSGEYPDKPGGPTTTYVYWDHELQSDSDNQRWLFGDSDNGIAVSVLNSTSGDIRGPQITVNNWTSNGSDTTNYDVNSTGDKFGHTERSGDWEFVLEVASMNNETEGTVNNGTSFSVKVSIHGQTSEDDWYNRLPLVGGAITSAEQQAGTLSWLGSVVLWAVLSFWEFVVNGAGMLFDVMSYVIGTLAWLANTYTGIVTADALPGWATVILATPGIALTFVWAKMTWIAVEIIWIG